MYLGVKTIVGGFARHIKLVDFRSDGGCDIGSADRRTH